MIIILKLAFRNIFRHKSRSFITLSTIIFGCVALIFVGGFIGDLFHKMRESFINGHTGHIQIYRKGFLEKGNVYPFDYLIDSPKEAIVELKKIKGIKLITTRLQFSGLLSTGENTVSFVGQGIEAGKETGLPLSGDTRKAMNDMNQGGMIIEAGKPLSGEDSFSVILGKGLASGISINAGDGVILLTNTTSGSMNAIDASVKGIFYTGSKAFDDNFLRLPIATAQKLLHTDSVQSLVIILDKTEDTQRVKEEFTSLFREKKLDFELRTWGELNDFYNKTVAFLNRQFFIIKLVIAIVVILSIFNTMSMAVMERTGEIGTIMAIGNKRNQVLRLFLCEGLGLGLIGGIIGIMSGVLFNLLIARIGIPMTPPPGSTMEWVAEPMILPGLLCFAFILSLATSLISSLYPAYKASRLQIADALRHAA